MTKTFVIDGFPESALRYRKGYAVVAVDVIRATTMAITAVAIGRRCFPAASLDGAIQLAARLENPILAGEIQGDMPLGFDMNNSPAGIAARTDISRPLVLLASSGTRLILNARGADVVYVACFRNSSAIGRRLTAEGHRRIAVLGAGSRGEFREEDQICCAWIGAQLVRAGYVPANDKTVEILNRWAHAKPSDCLVSNSVQYLRRTDQLADLSFILERINDLDSTFCLRNDEIVLMPPGNSRNRGREIEEQTAERFVRPIRRPLSSRA